MTEEVIVFNCGVEPYHEHIFPADWEFGGADGLDPRADRRYRANTYYYFDDKLKLIHTTQVPFCDDDALDRFTQVAGYGPDYNPVWLRVKRRDGTNETLPFVYDKATDTVYDS